MASATHFIVGARALGRFARTLSASFFVLGMALTLAALTPAHSAAQSDTAAVKKKKKAKKPFDAAQALNLATRQPMLAERSTKAFILVSRNVMTSRSRKQLDDSVNEFSSSLKQLAQMAPTDEIRENYELLEQLFEEFRAIKAKPPSRDNAAKLAEQNEEVVWIAQKGAQLLQAHAKSERSDIVVTAGDARTLTQRLAKLYLFRASGIKNTVIENDLKAAEQDYRAALAKLKAYTGNDAQINNELALAESQWIFLRQAIDRLNANQAGATELEHVSKACDNIAEVMERVTALYSRA
jgi:predicted RNA-binding protein with EMAP domain